METIRTKFFAYSQTTDEVNDAKGIAKIVIIECQQEEEAKVKLKKLGYEWKLIDESTSLKYHKFNIEMMPSIASYFIHFYDGSVVKEYNF